ncbi:MAG TPA: T9SS type A sorting domain-containing protein [Bacteroidales bacterium]|nr:T9SS type A sorting domain-containing protein [Bacteroidales bacterium]
MAASALNFDGVNDYISVASSPIINAPYTVECWAKPSTTGVLTMMGSRSGGTGNATFDFKFQNGNQIHGDIGDGTNWITTGADANFNYSTGTWYHIAYVVTNSGYKIYANGNQVGSGSFSGAPLLCNSSNKLGIGALSSTGGEYFNGNLDEVRVWNRELTQSEIQANMNCEIPTNSSGLIMNYHFNQGNAFGDNSSINYLTDVSGNSHTGTLNNFALASASSNWVTPGAVSTGVYCCTTPAIINISTYICSGSTFTITPVNGAYGTVPTGTTYSWSAPSVVGITGTTSGSYASNISGTLTNSTYSPINVVYTVTPNSGACVGSTFTVTVTVNPIPNAYITPNPVPEFCYGSSQVLTANTSCTSPSYEWFRNSVSTGISTSTYSATLPGSYTVKITSYGCNNTSAPAMVVVLSNSFELSVSQPATTGLTSGDYVWSGNTSQYWGTASNWLSYNGTAYGTASVVPTTANNVYFLPYSGCATNVAHIASGATGNCKDIIIKTSLIMDNTSVLNVYGNWDNQGTFTANNNTVAFRGSASQTIGGTVSTSFKNLTINNSSGLSNGVKLNVSPASPTIVTGTLTLTNGKLTSSQTNLLVLNAGSESSAGSINSFVDGPIKKIGSTAFVFPIGNETTWARIGIASLSGVEEFTAQYFNTGYGNYNISQSSPYVLDHVSEGEYWTLNRAGNKTATVRLYTENTEESAINDCNELVLAHWNGSSWENNFSSYVVTSAGCNTPTGQPLNIVSSESYTSFSPFTFGSKKKASNPLPVELVYFKAECDNADAIIYWQTATEINNDYFVVEKSNDMQDFFEIGIIPGSGNSNQLLNYSFTDNNLFSGNNYYRLKQIDYDGKLTIYESISVNCEKAHTGMLSMLAYPNPFNNELNIVVDEVKDKDFVIELFDQLGNIVFVEEYYSSENTFYITIDLTYVVPAVYNLRCRSNDHVIYLKLVKKY